MKWVVAGSVIAGILAALNLLIRPRLSQTRPNILLIITDDQRYDTMEYMPRTRSLIFDQGVEFSHAYATTPRCCPSRASILTGLYAHRHGVTDNDLVLDERTVFHDLREAGYFTGVVGKYLNSYPLHISDPPLPQFDYWVTFVSGAEIGFYVDPIFNVNGQVQQQTGYQTTLLRDYALDFLSKAQASGKPFALLFAPYAPHEPASPAPGQETLYQDLTRLPPPNYDEADVSDKPAWMQSRPRLEDDPNIRSAERYGVNSWRKQLRALAPLDETIETLINQLERQEALANTLIVFISDQGIAFGEHRLTHDKIFVYEEITHIPLAIRYPPAIAAPRTETRLVGNIDLAPTIYEVAGLPLPPDLDGRSLLTLLRGEEVAWRDALLIEGWPGHRSPVYAAVHTGRYVYVETLGQRSEFYDLESDPFQLENQIDNPLVADLIARLSQRLRELRPDWPPELPVGGNGGE
jgi:arylsulfatase A-like enzyme